MSNVCPLLPKLAVNRQFIHDLIDAKTPCFALSLVDERKQQCGLLALRPSTAIPLNVTSRGFNFGHSLLGNAHFEVIHFAFEFYGFGIYNVLLNPNSLMVQTVVRNMVTRGDYFILVIGPDQCVTAFRAGIEAEDLVGLKENLQRIQDSTTTEAQYQTVLAKFHRHPDPPGQLLNWVCRDKAEYLNLATDRLEMTPTAS